MATGGSHIGSGNGNRGKPYGLILLLAFGAALLGVMVLHKIRERRIFNLLVEEKDQELISLQLLLQPFSSSSHGKPTDFRGQFCSPPSFFVVLDPMWIRLRCLILAKVLIPTLATSFLLLLIQKERERSKEMKRKTEEMKAKIYSLRTQKMELDRRLLEMRSTIGSMKDEQKIMESALEERQSEIKMLRETSKGAGKETLQMLRYGQSAQMIHRNPPVNTTVTSNMINQDQIEAGKSEEEVLLQEYENYGDGLDSSRGNEVNNDQVYKSGSSQEKGTSGAGEENNASNATGTNVSRNGRVSKIVDADNDEKSMDGEEHKVTGDGKPGARKCSGGRRVGGERGEIGGRNRLLELRNHENNGAEKMRSSKFPTDGKAEETRKAMDSSDGKTMEHQNDEDSKDLQNKPGKDGTDHRMSEVHKTLKTASG
ncbi:hypothetical protein OIU76_015920 [Salix suchowensis]|nr:hypothetical protein OIU76_015920 [Salix suchowensis]